MGRLLRWILFFCFLLFLFLMRWGDEMGEEGDGGGGRWEMGRYGDGEMGDYGCDC